MNNPMDMIRRSQQAAQFSAAQAGLPQSSYSPQMSMAQQPNTSPVNPSMPSPASGIDPMTALQLMSVIDPSIMSAPDAPPAQVFNNAGNVMVAQPTPQQKQDPVGLLNMLKAIKGA